MKIIVADLPWPANSLQNVDNSINCLDSSTVSVVASLKFGRQLLFSEYKQFKDSNVMWPTVLTVSGWIFAELVHTAM